MTWLDWGEDLTQWVWNILMSLEWWTSVYNYGKEIENFTIKQCENSFKKTINKYRK